MVRNYLGASQTFQKSWGFFISENSVKKATCPAIRVSEWGDVRAHWSREHTVGKDDVGNCAESFIELGSPVE